jgi:hypothetical protein
MLFVLTAMAMTFAGCTGGHHGNPTQAGSETTNGDGIAIIAGVESLSGCAGTSMRIGVYEAHSIPGDTTAYRRTAPTDEQGCFTFENVPIGAYNVFALPAEDGGNRGAALWGVTVGIDRPEPNADSVGFDTLFRIEGTVRRDGTAVEGGRVYAAGSPFVAVTDQNGVYSLAGMPKGRYRLVAVEETSGMRTPVYADSSWFEPGSYDGPTINFDLKEQK